MKKLDLVEIKKNIDRNSVFNRLFAFLIDTIIQFAPLVIALYALILVVTGLAPAFLYVSLFSNTYTIFIYVFILIVPVTSTMLLKGQSIGKYVYKLRVVNERNVPANYKEIFIREFIGKSIPYLALFLLFNVLGVVIFIICDGIFVLIDKNGKSFYDYLSNTKVIALSTDEVKVYVEEKKKVTALVTGKDKSKKIDLHTFSTYSFKSKLTVEDIFSNASNNGVKYLSITDRNSSKANIQAEQFSKIYNIKYIPGIEIDCLYNNEHYYLLGYNFDYRNSKFVDLENESLAREKVFSIQRMEKFTQVTGVELDKDKLLQLNRYHFVSPQTIANDILSNQEYKDNPLLSEYFQGSKSINPIKSLVEDFFDEGKECYINQIYPNLEDMISLIHANGGIAILSRLHKKEVNDKFFSKLEGLKLDGYEVFNPYLSKDASTKILSVCKKNKILFTCGSYFGIKGNEISKCKAPEEAVKIITKIFK